ncbi:hypothetical protein Leryth_009103 [Lithospermum erythrorhizon]|nr:hypothetical protein Leryth_009103 [Lithospermum erythrorhizon]
MTTTTTSSSIDETQQAGLVLAKCECCGLTEECTEAYVSRVHQRHGGRWVCGLCGEAVKDEIARNGKKIGYEEALSLHMSFCKNFRASNPPPHNRSDGLISAVKHLLLRRLDSESPRMGKQLVRSHSCVPAFDS